MSDSPTATAPTTPIRVLIADDQQAFVRGLGVVLSIDGRIEVAGVAENGEEPLPELSSSSPTSCSSTSRCPG